MRTTLAADWRHQAERLSTAWPGLAVRQKSTFVRCWTAQSGSRRYTFFPKVSVICIPVTCTTRVLRKASGGHRHAPGLKGGCGGSSYSSFRVTYKHAGRLLCQRQRARHAHHVSTAVCISPHGPWRALCKSKQHSRFTGLAPHRLLDDTKTAEVCGGGTYCCYAPANTEMCQCPDGTTGQNNPPEDGGVTCVSNTPPPPGPSTVNYEGRWCCPDGTDVILPDDQGDGQASSMLKHGCRFPPNVTINLAECALTLEYVCMGESWLDCGACQCNWCSNYKEGGC